MMEEKIELLMEEQREHHDRIERIEKIKTAILFLIFVVLLIHLLYCPCPNAPATVKGYELDKYVEDQNGDPLEGATVILYTHPNGMIVAQGETDEHGWCNFTNIQYGRYFLWVSYGGVTSSEWVWITEDKEVTNTLTLPTEGLGHMGGIK